MNITRKVAVLGALVTTALISVGAQAAVITFDPIASTGTQFYSSYTEAGFSITSTSNSFASWGSTESDHTGSQALFQNSINGVTELSKVGGGAFSFDSIDLSELFNQTSYAATNVTFVGALSGGGTTSVSVDLDLIFGNQTFNFGNAFSSVTSMSWVQTSDFHQFDNLVMNNGTSVPEPSSLALVGLALAGLGVRRARRG